MQIPGQINNLQLGNLDNLQLGKINLGNLQPGKITDGKPITGTVESKPNHFDINFAGRESFSELLSNAINGVDNSIKASEGATQSFVSGKSDNIHEVMISMQKAQLSFQLMVEVRNKAIETYQEISRMQI